MRTPLSPPYSRKLLSIVGLACIFLTSCSQPNAQDAVERETQQAPATTEAGESKAETSAESEQNQADVAHDEIRETEPVSDGNLLANGDFTQWAPGQLMAWDWWKGHKISKATDDVVDVALKVECRPGQDITFVQPIGSKLETGKHYVIRGLVRAENASGNIALQVHRENGHVIGGTEPVAPAHWALVGTTFIAPPNPDDLKFVLRYRPENSDSGSTGATVWFADVRLTPKTK